MLLWLLSAVFLMIAPAAAESCSMIFFCQVRAQTSGPQQQQLVATTHHVCYTFVTAPLVTVSEQLPADRAATDHI